MDYVKMIQERIRAGEYRVNSEDLAESLADKILRYRDRIRAKESEVKAADRHQKRISEAIKGLKAA
jgi:phage shock protein A